MVTMDDHPPFQKRCYKILHLVCDHHPVRRIKRSHSLASSTLGA